MNTVTLQDAEDAIRRAGRELDRARQAGRVLDFLATPPPDAWGMGLALPAATPGGLL